MSYTVKPTSDAKSDSPKPSDRQQDEVLREWRESAYFWQKHAETIRTMFSPVTQALIDDAKIMKGDAVLDVAGGPGEPSLTIAETVGPNGSVTCTDFAPEMVAVAKAEAQRRAVANIEFLNCHAEALPFADSSFDGIVCRLGVMFFPDPLAGIREMLRVIRDEGTLAFAVWGKSELNPFSYLVSHITGRYFEAAPPDLNVPGAFRFSESGTLARILSEAGAVDVTERVLKFRIAAPISAKEFWEMRSETSGTLREKLSALSSSDRNRIDRDILEAVREFFPNNRMNFPAQMIIVSGKEPSARRRVGE